MKQGIIISCFVISFAVFSEGIGYLNDKCRLRTDCSKYGYFCSKNFTCQCLSPLYVRNNRRDRCVGIVGVACKYDEHCIDGAFCKEQEKCQCKEDYLPSEDNTECSIASFSKGTLVVPSIIFMGLTILGLG